MEVLDTFKRQIIYGWLGLKCEHSIIELESFYEDVYPDNKYLQPTGKYVCTKCGKKFTHEEYEKIMKQRK